MADVAEIKPDVTGTDMKSTIHPTVKITLIIIT